MTRNMRILAAILISAFVGTVRGQDEFQEMPTEKWRSVVPPMGLGNGIVVSNDSQVVYATSSDGSVSALDPDDGMVNWSYQPTSSGQTPLSCNGEITISNDLKFFVYGVSEGNEGDPKTCRVIALGHPAGDLLWVSPLLEGECSGTPVLSGDGKLVFLTHNSNNGSFGHFSILSSEERGDVLFTRVNIVAAYAPPGIVTNPVGGSFEGGENNMRDVIIWSYQPSPGADAVGPGRTFAFQLDRDYTANGGTGDFDVTILRPETSWQSTTAPLITSRGLRLYWSVTRSGLRAWIRQPNATGADGDFDGDRTHEADFERGDPPFLAPFVKPIVDNITEPKLLAVGAANEAFHCLSANDLETIWFEGTDSLIKTEARFSTKGDRVYFIEENGVIHALDALDGDMYWEEQASNGVRSNFDLSIDGAFLYYGDETGEVRALQLADSTLPPVAPATREPSSAPSISPPTTPTVTPNPATPPTTPRPTRAPTVPDSGAIQMGVTSMIGVTIYTLIVLLL